MKFLCDNCKAKYQIADEKLHGRAVQMKCRKCGHMIEVPAIMAPSTAAGAPAAPSPAASAAPAAAPSAAAVAPPPGAARPPAPKPAAPKPAAPKPAVPAPARPARPAPPAARPPVAPHAAPPAVAATPAPATSEAAPKSAAAGALAGAFAKTVKETEVSAAIEVLSAGAAEEWYVGINGVPLGPVRLSVLRQKASQGLVNEESLVWREGFDEWLPLRTFPELVVLVQEAREHAVRPVLTPAAGQAQRISALPQPPRAAAVVSAPAVVAAPSPVAAPHGSLKDVAAAALDAGQHPAPAPARPVPQSAAAQTAPQPAQPGSLDILADPFAAGAIAAKPGLASPAATPPEPAHAASEAHVAERHSVAPERHSVIDGIAGGVKRQVRLHPAAVAFIGLLGVLGGVLITVLLVGNKQPPVTPTVQIVTVTAPPATAPGGAPAASGIALAENEIVGDSTRPGGVRQASGKLDAGTNGPSEKPPGSPGEAAPLNVGLSDMPGMAGPNVGGPTPGAGNQSLPALEQSDIQRVVSQNVGFVRRQCWEPALASRSPNAPSSAKVTVAIAIGADGSVQSANASGGGGYPDLASCVASRVRGWRFPPSSGTSNASVPFVFAAQ